MPLNSTDYFIVERSNSMYKMDAEQLRAFVRANYIAADIAARDALTMSAGSEVYVVDAAADSTVNAGGAKYIYDGSNFLKIAEAESFDVTIAPTDLGYVAGAGNGTITSSSGQNAVIPLASASRAGLASPLMFNRTHVPASAAGSRATNPVTVDSGQEIGFSIDNLVDLP